MGFWRGGQFRTLSMIMFVYFSVANENLANHLQKCSLGGRRVFVLTRKCVFGDHRLCLHMLDLIRKLYCLFGILCFPAKYVRLAFSADFLCPCGIWALG